MQLVTLTKSCCHQGGLTGSAYVSNKISQFTLHIQFMIDKCACLFEQAAESFCKLGFKQIT